MFEDGSLCYNLLKQYIVVRSFYILEFSLPMNIKPSTPPQSPKEVLTLETGQEVQVEWSDGITYSSKLLGWHVAAVYQVSSVT